MKENILVLILVQVCYDLKNHPPKFHSNQFKDQMERILNYFEQRGEFDYLKRLMF